MQATENASLYFLPSVLETKGDFIQMSRRIVGCVAANSTEGQSEVGGEFELCSI
jgi:hypothetical protein